MIAVAAYFVYDWLVSNGYLGSTVAAASNAFTDPASLMNYCQANPTGSASYNGSLATCASWIAANSPASPAPAPVAPTSSNPYQQAIQAMQAAAGNDSQNLDGWSYYWQNAPTFASAPSGFGVSGSISPAQMGNIVSLAGGNRNSNVSAEQFVQWVQQSGPVAAPVYGGVTPGMQGISGWVM
jgi:hypothetical protein